MAKNKFSKDPVPSKSKLKKDPGIPRLPIVKDRSAPKPKAAHPTANTREGDDAAMDTDSTVPSLVSLAAQAQAESFIPSDPSSSTSTDKTKEQIRRHYVRALHKVIDESDIVILVLDARDPEGCRSRLVEEEVRRRESEGKKLVFVLNKIDLVLKDNAQQWLRYLRHSTPTLPFRSASSAQRTNLSSTTAPALLRLLKAYKPHTAQSLTVGVVGYPNVGKSSLINSLKRSKVCSVAARPGHTKDIQSIQLEKGIRIVDSPGVIFDDDDYDYNGKGTKKGSVLLRNVVKPEDIEDPVSVVEEILVRTDHELVQKIYNLPQFGSTMEFLTMLAMTTGRLLKGGTPDLMAAARQVLVDWNHQKIPYFSVPPTVHPSSIPSTVGGQAIAPGAESVGQAQIVTELGKAFTLDGLFGDADQGAFGDSPVEVMEEVEETVPVGDKKQVDEDVQMDADGGGMSTESEDFVTSVSRKRSRAPSPSPAPSAFMRSIPQPLKFHISDREERYRAPKRLRKSKDADEEHEMMSLANPMNRAVLRREAKKLRRAANKGKAVEGGEGEDVGLAETFIVEGNNYWNSLPE